MGRSSLAGVSAFLASVGMAGWLLGSSGQGPGPNTLRGVGGSRGVHAGVGCSDCHVPHRGEAAAADGQNGPLWSTRHTSDGLPTFAVYSSRRFDALRPDVSQPDGASRLCLGCHDGSDPQVVRGGRNLVISPDDLARGHPVSFVYDRGLALRARVHRLKDPTRSPSGLGRTIAADLLDGRSKMQCTSCHDPHAGEGSRSLLRYPYDPTKRSGSTFCQVCHEN